MTAESNPKSVEITLQFGDASIAYSNGQFDQAFAMFSDLVDKGYLRAFHFLAEMHFRGEGTCRNSEIALELLKQATERGDAISAFNLGALFRNGAYGVSKSPLQSQVYFRRAQELGCSIDVTPWTVPVELDGTSD